MATVVAVDPGGTTGIAVWSPGLGLSLREIKPAAQAVDWLAQVASHGLAKTFVVERYVITPATAKMSQQHDALEITGALKYLARKHGHSIVIQTPAEAKKFSTDAKLKNVGWYEKSLGQGFEGHARDASRHLLLFLAKQGIIDLHTLIGGNSADL